MTLRASMLTQVKFSTAAFEVTLSSQWNRVSDVENILDMSLDQYPRQGRFVNMDRMSFPCLVIASHADSQELPFYRYTAVTS